uniref:Thyroid receptor-interacting protein 6-like n=1 Tax=Pelodiscus sinensis TaxID=13735 RepID=K7G3I6_PELSI|nr:thyroid receptor-interacting protein 6-like isoform X1 [Pelodiscus sinensis]|eukprot:XP_006112195.1 thyroid receptor-interacting protein 6-like isoform X1 [Pelodiscus sinensis]
MSGPTWLPPKRASSSGSPGVSVSAPALCKPQKKHATGPASPRLAPQEQNGEGMSGTGYQPEGPGSLSPHHQDPRGLAPLLSSFGPLAGSQHHHPSVSGAKDERGLGAPWGAALSAARGYHIQGSALDPGPHRPSSIDAQIDSLTHMLADMESTGPQRQGERQNFDSVPYPSATAPPQPGAHKMPSPYKPGSFAPPCASKSSSYGPLPQPATSMAPSGPAPPYGAGYPWMLPGQKLYPQPMPASYTTASTSAGPAFNIQVKVPQPVLGYGQPRRRAEQAYAPPSPGAGRGAQYGSEPGGRGVEGWYLEPGGYGKRLGEGECYEAGGLAKPGEASGTQYQAAVGTPGKEEMAVSAKVPPGDRGGYQHQTPLRRPEEELDRLTRKLVHDMNHPPAGEYFGRCARCGENVVGDGTGCVAMDQVFHVHCFTCATCHARLRGQPFYAIERRAYCEACYVVTLEKCSMCSKPIMDRILRAMGKAYHPQCFTCVVCHHCLDGVPFTVDATSQVHCIEDFHRKFAPRCSVCGNAIMPEPGQEETVRIVALDRSFHIGCYKCEECGLLLSSEGEGRGCYPLDGHVLCRACSARRIQELSAKVTTDC